MKALTHELERRLSSEERASVLGEAAADAVPALSGWGALLYLLFAIAHVFVLPQQVWRVMTPLAGLTAVGMGALAWRSARRRPAPSAAHPMLTALLLAGIVNSGVHLALTRDALQSTNFVLVFIAAAFVLLSLRALLLTTVLTLGTWFAIASWLGGGHEWTHLGFAIVTTAAGALVAVTFRRRVALRLAASARAVKEALADAERELERRQRTEAELRGLSQALEERVKERTRELERSHTRLLSEMEERRIAERTLEQKNDQLRQAQRLETLGLLAGGVAHDFNNLLTVFMGCAELAKQRLPEGNPAADLMTEIETAAGQASRLTRQLLAFGRQQVLDPRPTNLNDVLRKLQPLFARLLGGHVELALDLAPSLALSEVDAAQFEQVLANLALNARDAMPDGGRLTIKTRNVNLREKEHGELAAGRYVLCEFSDTGVGMDEAVRARAFEPFFTTKGALGSGLGLASVHGTVKQSRGEIEVESVLGCGTSFRIYLPVAQPLPPALAAETKSNGRAPRVEGPARILLVEDNPPLRHLLEQALQEAGFDVISAAEGRAALDRVNELHQSIDLVVTDVRMPGMGGRELVERLKSKYAKLRALFMSAYAEDDLLRFRASAEAGLLQKPFSGSHLVNKVREMLASPSAPQST